MKGQRDPDDQYLFPLAFYLVSGHDEMPLAFLVHESAWCVLPMGHYLVVLSILITFFILLFKKLT